MRKGRYLAPWHREGVVEAVLAAQRAEEEAGRSGKGDVAQVAGGVGNGVTGGGDLPSGGGEGVGDLAGGGRGLDGKAAAKALAALRGKPAIYHCVSRVVNREFVLKRAEREEFVRLMRIYERFSQVKVLSYCVLSNHFHLLVEVPAKPEDGGASWSDEKLMGHLACLYDEAKLGKIRWELEHYRAQKNEEAAEALRQKFLVRMWDLSAFMKVLKQRFTQWFNRTHARRGTLWEERFKSELVEDGKATRRVSAYIDLNPVRAGMVSDPKDYRWSGYGDAVAGGKAARAGLRLVLYEEWSGLMGEERAERELSSWREVVAKYRVVLFEDGEVSERDRVKGRAGIAKEAVAKVLAQGGELSEAQLGWCRVRAFGDGLVLGSEGFVEAVYTLTRDYFGAKRQSGARKLRGVHTEMRALRDLQKDPLSM